MSRFSLWLPAALAVCALSAAESKVEPAQPQFLTLKNGQRAYYDEIHKEGATYVVRMGASTTFIDAAEVVVPTLPSAPAPAPISVPDPPIRPTIAPHAQWIDQFAGLHNLRPELIQAVMEVESGYQVNARSHAGAIGLMQLMPPTAKFLKVNPHDPAQNVEGGARLLDMLVKKYEGRKNGLALALAAYNSGAGRVDAYGGVPPIQETQRYVRKVLSRYRELVRANASSDAVN